MRWALSRSAETHAHRSNWEVLTVATTSSACKYLKRGDLLVTSSTGGRAMKAASVTIAGVDIYPTGTILGKALEPFDRPGEGMIDMLVNVK